ncbi:crotonobetainyl-CoA:carnitine CoA-transferase CaiB-like acyl-CoA transferase [Actinocorallia herbida]|uniref:Crotonobetainyl-CoA:carnitine CoA-transferase CaiB-like acyl-CoA transferase n=1 Tax=Actinocorallia herbida TaxID=58109 RepID=A0A3N1CUG6_9ACTN|nr:CoA transferase [Actinocorallia herbida]ROO84951.1 crotonobetainyl-CoA:carnitine CoA-transferase CaiB-like acyl-CoA transferase [Actinocorallia herbida]
MVEATQGGGLLSGLRVVECSMLGPGAVSTPLADLGADVIKVEPPSGDYIRAMSWPIVEGRSLLHLHISRGKRSIVLDLRTEDGKAVFLDLVKDADVVVEAMRPGGLDRRGLGYAALREINPKVVMFTISGYGMTGPYRDLPSHGIAYDAWAGTVTPVPGPDGLPTIPDHTSIGITAGPLFGTAAILAAVIRARESGEGCHLEVAQSDAAAAFDWLRSEGHRAYERPADEVTGNPSDGFERRPPGTAGMEEGVRYQFYASKDGHVLFMASEQKFWRNFCAAVGRDDLYEANPGSKLADHARGNLPLRHELAAIFAERTTAEWIELGLSADVPIGPANTPASIAHDPQFADRMPWQPAARLVADQLPFPVRVVGEAPPAAALPAPEPGEHTEEILRDVLGYDAARLTALRASGALGS